MSMRSLLLTLALAAAASGLSTPAAASEGGVVRFATLPAGPGHPEGIAADQHGNIYAATFAFGTQNFIYVFGRNGRLQNTIPVPGVPLGMEFDAAGNLYVANFGGGNVLRFTPPFRSNSTPAVLPVTGCDGPQPPPPATPCGLNAITFDAAGDLYVSDSFGGRIFRIVNPGGNSAGTPFFQHELLKPGSHGFPPFGANGLAFDANGTHLYIANTADDRILKLTLAGLALAPFAESINGADGIAFDAKGRLWVAANQADEVVALNDRGRIVERRGSFQGIAPDGAAKGLIFPASIVISGGSIYVTNAALALTDRTGDEPEEDVRTFTVSRFRLDN